MTNELQNADRLSCQDAAELLPWLLNGSLEAGEWQDLVAHLAECESCRRELEETEAAWGVFTQHIPSLDLAEYAQGMASDGMDRERIERHLASCPSCRRELELATPEEVVDLETAREERRLVERLRGTERATEKPVRSWRRLAAAASFVATLSSGALVWSVVQSTSLAPNPADSTASMPLAEGVAQQTASESTGIFVEGFESGTLTAWSTVSQ